MVKSKLPPQSGSSLEAVEPHPKKGAIKFFDIIIIIIIITIIIIIIIIIINYYKAKKNSVRCPKNNLAFYLVNTHLNYL